MGRLRTITRRSLLIGSAAIAGGVAFGVWRVKTPYPNPLEKGLPEGSATFNPYVIVSPEKITLIAPHADSGQGIMSAQAALIAEEMDLDLGQFEVSFGQPDRAYWNRVVAEDGLPLRSDDDGRLARMMRGFVTGGVKILGLQATGGSSSIPDSFERLREAGAIARETLKLAAAEQFDVEAASLSTASGAVKLPKGEAIPYTDLAQTAAGIAPTTAPTLRNPAQGRLIGKPMQRLDMVAKSTGTQGYGIDITLPGMLFATVRTNPRLGGDLLDYDATAATQMRGVHKVVPVTGGVAVIADNTWRAFQAAQAIDCNWGAAPYPAEQADHWKALETALDGRHDLTYRNDGDVSQALAQGNLIEATYKSPYAAHQPLEPLNATVLVNTNEATIWTGHQLPGLAAQRVAYAAGLKTRQVTMHNQFMGGSFGHRFSLEFVELATQVAAQMPGTPIKTTYQREEDFTHNKPRHIAMGRARGRVANGRVEALDLGLASPSVTSSKAQRVTGFATPGPDVQTVAGAWNAPYDLANFRVRGHRAGELLPVAFWRSVGALAGGFMIESFMDELIHAAGADPIEERLRLIPAGPARTVLETAADMASWGTALPADTARGVALVTSFGVPMAEIIEIQTTDQGLKMTNVWAAADVGRVVDPVNLENQVQGGIVWGLGHAINAEITVSDGMIEQDNYYAHDGLRINQCPNIFVQTLENAPKIRGIGEPSVPPAAPALANAIFAATGTRLREMPFASHVDFA